MVSEKGERCGIGKETIAPFSPNMMIERRDPAPIIVIEDCSIKVLLPF
jgi:hypothetical protein